MVFSASAYTCSVSAKYNHDSAYLLKKQVTLILAGVVLCFFMQYVDYRLMYKASILIYVAGLLSILLLLSPLRVSAKGATRWIAVFGIRFQVAEVVKISVIVFQGYLLRRFKGFLHRKTLVFYMWLSGGIAAFALKVVSNDLSSCLVVLAITVGISFVYTHTEDLHIIAGVIVGSGIFVYVKYISKNLPTVEQLENMSFRIGRIAAWLAPEEYSSNQVYQTLQALYAIGSGGVFGKGLGKSVQKLTAIPEAQNDMIFSIICEELGIFGAAMLLILFGYLLWCLVRVAISTKDIFGSAITTGIMLHIGVQVLMNVSVNLNVIPNTGIALPFISYGGTAILCQLAEIAIVLSVARVTVGMSQLGRQEKKRRVRDNKRKRKRLHVV